LIVELLPEPEAFITIENKDGSDAFEAIEAIDEIDWT
jgi:hypothetical protein